MSDSNGPRALDRIFRPSPIVDITWTSAQGNLQAKLGFADLTPRASFTARLNERLWLEARFTAAGLARRNDQRFEHPYYLFITPRIKF